MISINELIRIYRSDPDNIGNQEALLLALGRKGDLSPEILKILKMIGNSVADQYIPVFEYPPLYIVSGVNDPLDIREAARIDFMSQFEDATYINIWLNSALTLLHYFSGIAFTKKNKRKYGYLIQKEDGMNLDSELANQEVNINLLEQDIRDALNFLRSNNHPENQIRSLERRFHDWSLILSEDYIMGNFDFDLRDSAQRKQDYYARILYNLVEMINYILKVRLGTLGEPYQIDGEYNPDYVGGPFLFYWRNGHASLNPGHHLNMGNTSRLNRSYNNDGSINMSVVLSNLLTGCYLIYGFLLGLSSRNINLYHDHQKTKLSTKDLQEINRLEEEIDTLAVQISQIQDSLKADYIDYFDAVNEWDQLYNVEDDESLDDEELEAQEEARHQRMEMLEDIIGDFEANTEIPQLEAQIEELANGISQIENSYELKILDSIDNKISNKFWEDFKDLPDSLVINALIGE